MVNFIDSTSRMVGTGVERVAKWRIVNEQMLKFKLSNMNKF